ncbi:tumor necrosis factor receptor superfamily member 14 isoform X2 [Hypomesus transpacificus]|uniref:tumor necrosis factor receptor superfamily member 14 isoform X2 n=1 Tax=Hypomesus transpacificus TaxID=137520 RepID=UPI001F075514|nr:tumor necrosis factor receptor superfamily member 14 isoform X2 [Hypomesus transpacificus]
MAGKKNCKPEEYQHLSEDRCCDKCPKGQHVFKDCTQTEQTMCERCKHNEYTADRNFLRQCLPCRDLCHSKSNMKTARECQADQDRQCECVFGYYFVDKDKTHCATVTECDPGSEVKVNATIGNDTVCAPCMPGTFSSTKGLSPCKPHSNCEKLGQELKSAGTDTSDAKCHLIIPSCSWMLPAGLWVGVVVTSIFIILFCIIYWRMKRQSYHTASSPCRLTVEPVVIREPLCPCPELGKHCQETCDGEKSLKPVFVNSGKSPVLNLCHQHCDIESDGPSRIPLMDRSGQSVNDMNGHSTISLVRMTSEPQEDEWGGT